MKFRFLLYILFSCSFLLGQNNPPPIAEKVEVNDEYVYEDVYEDDEKTDTYELLKDSTYVLNDSLRLRKFNPDFQQKYSDSEFDYSTTKPRMSFWEKLQRKLSEWLSHFFKTEDANTLNNFTWWFIRIVAIGIIGLVVYWLLRFVLMKEGNWFWSKKNEEINPNAQTITENIHEINFPQLISQYETQKDFRYAVRYHYLHLLKIFTDRKLLEWDPEKTNLDYINEIQNPELKEQFRQLTLIFDYVWYGEFLVDEEAYEKIQVQFKNLKTAV